MPGPGAPPAFIMGILVRENLRILLLSAVLVTYNNAAAFMPDRIRDPIYVPMNLLALGLLLLWAVKGIHLGNEHLGLIRNGALPAGALGLLVGLAVPAPLFISVVLPHAVIRVATNLGILDMPTWELVYRTAVRLPLGTALWEEIAFRGVLYGLWNRAHGGAAALVGSSVVFGLWHVAPTYQSLTAAEVLDSRPLLVGAMAGAVVVTFVGGLMFGLLRIYSRNIVGCIVCHWLINSLTTVAFFMGGSVLRQ